MLNRTMEVDFPVNILRAILVTVQVNTGGKKVILPLPSNRANSRIGSIYTRTSRPGDLFLH